MIKFEDIAIQKRADGQIDLPPPPSGRIRIEYLPTAHLQPSRQKSNSTRFPKEIRILKSSHNPNFFHEHYYLEIQKKINLKMKNKRII